MKSAVSLLLILFTTYLADARPPVIGLLYQPAMFRILESSGVDQLNAYRSALKKHGGVVIELSPAQNEKTLAKRIAQLDGLLLPGGSLDVDPIHYNQKRQKRLLKIDPTMDALQFRLLREARKHQLPVLGICLGQQAINVFYGGSLLQDIPSGKHKGKDHAITVMQDSVLGEIMNATGIVVNSRHHQAVQRVAPGFIASASAADGIIEVIEHKGDPFIMGVQFHPELLLHRDSRFNAIFKHLVDEASTNRRLGHQLER
jgi:putative glutamine amidotransferase